MRNTMVLNKISALVFFGLIAVLSACNPNGAYEEVKSVSKRLDENPSDREALAKIVDGAQSSSKWKKYYALVFLGKVMKDRPALQQENSAVFVIMKALKDNDQATRQDVARALSEFTPEFLNLHVSEIATVLDESEDNGYSWALVESLERIDDCSKLQIFLPKLLEIAVRQLPTPVSGDLGPNVVSKARDAIKKLKKMCPSESQVIISRQFEGRDSVDLSWLNKG